MGKIEDWVARANVARFRRKLSEARSPDEREAIEKLLNEQERLMTRAGDGRPGRRDGHGEP